MTDFIPFVQELLVDWGEVSSRRMFGGHGLYHECLIFAIVVNQRLYLKADAVNRPDFEALGLTPFTFPMKGKAVALSYWAAPESIFDDAQDAVRWAISAWEAALRGHQAKAQAREKAKARLQKRAVRPFSKDGASGD
jgi:DNA transformation protein